MKRKVRFIISFVLVIALCFSASALSLGHSGRTDSSGGHRDNKNASGLGYYHYHHGCPPHLHPGGVCPYSSYSSQASTATKASTSVISAGTSAVTNLYRPKFPVIVNGYNLNDTVSIYYPAHMKGIVYIPLSTEMIQALGLSGGYTDANGMVLNSTGQTANVYSFNKAYGQISPQASTKTITKPSFAVIVNGKNINVTSTDYYPVMMNYIVYVPLSSEILDAMNLQGGYSDSSGLVLNSSI